MSFRRLLSQEATVVTRPISGRDPYNNPAPGPEARATYPARLEQTGTSERTVDRNTVVSTFRLFLPPEAVVDALDRVEVDGESYEVVGEPNRLTTPRGLHHLELELRLVRGA